jgi:hypothetical protein
LKPGSHFMIDRKSLVETRRFKLWVKLCSPALMEVAAALGVAVQVAFESKGLKLGFETRFLT